VAWTSSDSPAANVRGARVENDLRISGSRDTVLELGELVIATATARVREIFIGLIPRCSEFDSERWR
jgi:hypothetical protein